MFLLRTASRPALVALEPPRPFPRDSAAEHELRLDGAKPPLYIRLYDLMLN
jgi:hypothetical protein